MQSDIKFDQLIDYNMRNMFLAENVVEELVSHPFIKNQN